MKKLIEVKKTSLGYSYKLSPMASKCQFLKFLINASNHSWRKPLTETTSFDALINHYSLVAKLSAIGYLFQPVKDRENRRAVIAINGSDCQSSANGKSLFCRVLLDIAPSVCLNGRFYKSMINDDFIFDQVRDSTKILYIDDVDKKFPFSFLLDIITNGITVNRIRMSSFKLPYELAPHILLSKEMPFSNLGASASGRQWYLSFSDYYHKGFSPYEEFQTEFINGWDTEQYKLLNQLIVECQQIYLEYGVMNDIVCIYLP